MLLLEIHSQFVNVRSIYTFAEKSEYLEARFDVSVLNLNYSNILLFLDLFEIRALPRAIQYVNDSRRQPKDELKLWFVKDRRLN